MSSSLYHHFVFCVSLTLMRVPLTLVIVPFSSNGNGRSGRVRYVIFKRCSQERQRAITKDDTDEEFCCSPSYLVTLLPLMLMQVVQCSAFMLSICQYRSTYEQKWVRNMKSCGRFTFVPEAWISLICSYLSFRDGIIFHESLKAQLFMYVWYVMVCRYAILSSQSNNSFNRWITRINMWSSWGMSTKATSLF
jgi:hypothetical protein